MPNSSRSQGVTKPEPVQHTRDGTPTLYTTLDLPGPFGVSVATIRRWLDRDALGIPPAYLVAGNGRPLWTPDQVEQMALQVGDLLYEGNRKANRQGRS